MAAVETLQHEQASMQVDLATLGGCVTSTQVDPDTTVQSLRVLAKEQLHLCREPILLFGDKILTPNSELLITFGLGDGAVITVMERDAPSFVAVYVPPYGPEEVATAGSGSDGDSESGSEYVWRDAPESCITFSSGKDEDFHDCARFKPGFGYRCLVATALPSHGRQAVALTFDLEECATSISVGLHMEPDAIVDGPPDNYGWIGSTSSGLCLDCPFGDHVNERTHLRHSGDAWTWIGKPFQIWEAASEIWLATLVLTVDHIAQRVIWTSFLTASPSEKCVVSCELPAALVGKPLWPCVVGGCDADMTVTIGSADQ